MTKFLAIKLIEPQAAPILAEPEEAKKKSKLLLFAVVSVLIAVLAFTGWNYLPKIAPQLAMKRFARTGAPRVPQSGSGKVTGEKPPRLPQNQDLPQAQDAPVQVIKKVTGPIPWLGRTAPLLELVGAVSGKVLSLTTGAEGALFVEGILPVDVNIQTESPLFRSDIIEVERLLTFDVKKGETEYVIILNLAPVMSLNESLQSVPPYMRGAMISEIDSLARSFGLTSVRTVPVDREEIEGGSRYLIGLQASGKYLSVVNFVRAVESSGRMIEISRFSCEGIDGKSIKEDVLKCGFIFRVYDLKTQSTGEAPIS